MSLYVVKPGLATRVVDAGRPRSRSLGVPVGGAADRWSLALGNALVGNKPDAAAVEIALAGPTLRAEVDLACVVFGAPFELSIVSNNQLRESVVVGKTFTLSAGDELHIGGTPVGTRAYLCVAGGLQTPVILESRSSLDILHGGENLACLPGLIAPRFFPPDVWKTPGPELHVLHGPQADWFQESELYSQEFTITPASNRMGLRLEGRPLTMQPRELVSEPVAPGAVQVTRDGQCIVLGVDGQTIGGYPKIAHVISADLDALGQLRPGDKVRFVQMALEEAVERWKEREQILNKWLLRAELSAG
jgi:antagonist of KipI